MFIEEKMAWKTTGTVVWSPQLSVARPIFGSTLLAGWTVTAPSSV